MSWSKGQWFLIAGAIIITMLAALHNLTIKKLQTETLLFETEETLLEKIEFLVSRFLTENFESTRSKLISNMVSAFDISTTLASSHGMNSEVFCLCEYDNTSNLLVMSFFNTSVNYSISSQDTVSSTISKLGIKEHGIVIGNNITLRVNLGQGDICAYHYYRTNFCACIFSIEDRENIFIGKTLNLNWC